MVYNCYTIAAVDGRFAQVKANLIAPADRVLPAQAMRFVDVTNLHRVYSIPARDLKVNSENFIFKQKLTGLFEVQIMFEFSSKS